MERLPRPPESFFEGTPPHVRAYIDQLHAVIDHLYSVVEKHEARIADLEAQLRQNSRNSSKPPSSDGPHVKPAPGRTSSGRKRGGQPGHTKRERTILSPDEVHDHKPLKCHHCDAALTGSDPDCWIEQVIELPVKLRHVVHHRRHTLTCPDCHFATTASLATPGGFGPRFQAVVAYLSGVGRLSKRVIRQFFADVCDIPLSLGMVSKLERKTSTALAPLHAEALTVTQKQNANIDETGWRQGTKRAWLWVARTAKATAYLIRPTRSRVAFNDLRPTKVGILTTDRYPVYDHRPVDRRQLCWAHLRRDFQAMIDRDDTGAGTGRDLLLNADVLFQHWKRVRDGTLTRTGFHKHYASWLRDEVRSLLVRGTTCGSKKTQIVCNELLSIEEAMWTFTRHDGIEPTNNAAERSLRHAVCWRKTSFGTDSEVGSRFVERILTVSATARQYGRDVLATLTQAIQAFRNKSTPPSIVAVGV